MRFHKYLQRMLDEKNIRQVKLLHKLQLFHPTFEGLDAITLSRWCNDKTLPSLKKQLLVANYFEKDLSYFIQHINPPKLPTNFIKPYNTAFDKIETSYSNVGYNAIPKAPATLSMLNLSKDTHRHLFRDFYEHMEAYQRVFAKIDENNEVLRTTAFTIKKGDQIVSHLAFNDDVAKISCHFRQTLPSSPQKKPDLNAILLNVGYYYCRGYYESLIGHLFNHLIDRNLDVETCYVVTRGKDFLELMELMDGECLLAAQEPKAIGNVYLLRFDFKQLLAHPFIFQQVQRTYLSYPKLKQALTIPLPVLDEKISNETIN